MASPGVSAQRRLRRHEPSFMVRPVAHGSSVVGQRPAARFLGKESVFKVPLVGQLLLNCGQIPVYRDTDGAADSVRAAVAAVEAGEAVVVILRARSPGTPNCGR